MFGLDVVVRYCYYYCLRAPKLLLETTPLAPAELLLSSGLLEKP